MTELEKLFDQVRSESHEGMVKDGGILPTFFCHVPGVDGCGIIPCMWNGARQKQHIIGQVKAKFKELNIERFAFYGESWSTERAGVVSGQLIPIARERNRKECILVYAEDRNGQSKIGWWPLREAVDQLVIEDFVVPNEAPTEIGMSFANMFGVTIFQ